MIRMFVYVALLLAAGLGFAYLMETPGSVALTYGGNEYRVTLAKGMVLLALLVLAIMALWSALRLLFRLPSLLALSGRMRRRNKGYAAVSRGLVSVGVGDHRAATRAAVDAERLLGREPMTLLLKAQAAQLSGDRKGAEGAFARMLDKPETKILGLRGLFIEARRNGDDSARAFAEEAYRISPAAPWAGEAVLEYRTADKDWRGAMAAVDENASRRIVDRESARRQKAALLTGEALDTLDRNPDAAFAAASDALKLNPALAPAAQIVAQRLSARGDYRKAARLLEGVWKRAPHPDVAEAYLSLRHGDSSHDKLKRAKVLAKMTPKDREAGLALARAAIDAREFGLAREQLERLVLEQPTARACRLMAELEDKESGDAGLVRKWLSRASHAPRDPGWVADGFVSDHWAPFSPVTGRIDAFQWTTPAQSLEASVRASIDADRIAAPAAEAETEAAEAAPLVIEQEPEEPAEEPKPAPAPNPAPAPDPAPAPVSDPQPAPVEAPPPAPPAPVVEPKPPVQAALAPALPAAPEAPVGALPIDPDHQPDDPGPRAPEPGKKKRRFFV